MSRARCLIAMIALVALVAPGCKSRDEWLFSVQTNLPVPQFGDRVYIEVLDSNGKLACDDCARQFGPLVDGDFPLTFGIVKTSSTVRVRTRLYRSITIGPDGLPAGPSLVDVVVQLPPLGSGVGNANVASLFLPSLCFGQPPDLAAHTTCSGASLGNGGLELGPEPVLDLFASPVDYSRVTVGRPAPCTGAPPDGMACVGSGSFLIGDERVGLASDYPAQPVQARTMYAPVALDIDEMTVGAVRKLVAKRLLSGSSGFTRRGAAGTSGEGCTYQEDGSSDALPMNCVTRAFAQKVCVLLDRRLPTESEWEFAAVNGAAETHYPWGEPEATTTINESTANLCARAVVGRGRAGAAESTACGGASGPVARGSDGDVTKAGLRNMGGNLAEWVAGEFAFYTEKCWSRSTFEFEINTPCEDRSTLLTDDKPRVPYRGGSWTRPPEASAGANRFAAPDDVASPAIGFRCAWIELAVP